MLRVTAHHCPVLEGILKGTGADTYTGCNRQSFICIGFIEEINHDSNDDGIHCRFIIFPSLSPKQNKKQKTKNNNQNKMNINKQTYVNKQTFKQTNKNLKLL